MNFRALGLKRFTFLSFGAFLAIALVSFAALPAAAASRESITLSPVSKHYDLKAGQVADDNLKVVNDGTTAYSFIVYTRPYSVNNNDYSQPNFSATPQRADAYSWIQFKQTKWHIEPGQTVTVHYKMRVPKAAASGGHYGVIFAETQPSDSTDQSVARKKRVGSILYATVDGQLIQKGSLVSSAIDWYQSRPPLSASSTVKNSGNVDFNADVTMTVKDVFGNQKYSRHASYAVLPGTSRQLMMEWSNGASLGLFKVDMQTKFLDKSSTASSYVLMVPRWLLILVLVIVAGGTTYGLLRRRR